MSQPVPVLNRETYHDSMPFDISLKKYHSDIGSRLSEMTLPEQYTNNADNLTNNFRMLTIDTRRVKSCKQRRNAPQSTTKSDENQIDYADNSVPDSSTSAADATFNIPKGQINRSHKKKHLLEKFTCSLFLKKHLCSRCKRKSRSCVSNRTSREAEKRYMCFKCRETSDFLKNIFNGQCNSKSSQLSHSTPKNKDRSIPSHRKNINDSGYDTVTSCSTVASAYSAFSTPANIRQNINKDRTSKPLLYGDQDFVVDRSKRSSKFNDSNTNYEPATYKHSGYSNPESSGLDSESVSDFLRQLASSENDLTHTSPRNNNQSDNNLSNTDYNSWNQKKPRSVLSDTSNLEHSSENGDFCYFPPRIVRVSQPDKCTDSVEKSCYTCHSTSKPCFRLPWAGGWICEDCLDGLH